MSMNACLLLWAWRWPDNLDKQTWPRYSEGAPTHQKWKFLDQVFQKLENQQHRQAHKQTDECKHITRAAFAALQVLKTGLCVVTDIYYCLVLVDCLV